MSERFFFEYRASQRLSANIWRYAGPGNEFYTVLITAMRLADTDNLNKLRAAFPDVYNELRARYYAPGGALTQDELKALDRYYEHSGDEEEGG